MLEAKVGAPPKPRGWGIRHRVFAIICLINLTIWLDEHILGALTPFWSRDLHLTPTQIGTSSAAYLISYFPLLFIAGILADRFGPRRMLAICIIGCSILSVGMLLVEDYTSLVVRNFLFGLFFGFLWAPCNQMIALWLPAQERVRYAAIWYSSNAMSNVIAAPLGLLLASAGNWHLPFIIVAVLGVPCMWLLIFKTTDRPEEMKGISPEELYFIRSDEGAHPATKVPFSWGELFRVVLRPGVLWMVVATFFATAPNWLMSTWGFYHLVTIYKVDGATASWLVGGAYIATTIYCFFHGWVFQHVFGGRYRLALATGPIIGCIGFLTAAHATSPTIVALAVFISGTLCNAFFWGTVSGYWAQVARPEFSGTLNGISAAGQVVCGYVILSLSGTWVRPIESAGIHALDHLWTIGGLIFLLALIPIFLAQKVRSPRVKAETRETGIAI